MIARFVSFWTRVNISSLTSSNPQQNGTALEVAGHKGPIFGGSERVNIWHIKQYFVPKNLGELTWADTEAREKGHG